MYFVYSPSYDYDEEPILQEFKTLSEVTEFIEEDLKRSEHAPFHHTPGDYAVIDGKALKVEVVQYVAKVKIIKS